MSTDDIAELPEARVSEDLVLGALLGGMAEYDEIASVVTSEDFLLDKHKRIYRTISRLADGGKSFDLPAVAQVLQDDGHLGLADGISYLVDLRSNCPSRFNLDWHLEQISRRSDSRRLIEQLSQKRESLLLGADPEEIRAELAPIVSGAVSLNGKNPSSYTAADIVTNAGGIDAFLAKKPMGIPTPIARLNELTNGFQPKQMVVIGARTSQGKTALATQIALVAAGSGLRTEFGSLEMSKESVLLRMAGQVARVCTKDVERGVASQEDRVLIGRALSAMSDLPLRIDDNPGTWTLPEIRKRLKAAQASGQPIDLLVIDYLQLIQGPKAENRVQELGAITRAIKLMAVQFGCAVILPAQVGRENERENREPRLSDLRESGSIEMDSDVVLLVNHHYGRNETREAREATINLAKQREGPTERIPVIFEKPYTRFVDKL